MTGAKEGGSPPRSPRTIAVDNFLRKALRVGDPRDPAQVAAASARYPEEAEKERREQGGVQIEAGRNQPKQGS